MGGEGRHRWEPSANTLTHVRGDKNGRGPLVCGNGSDRSAET
jgi:hypothetical protein